MERSQNRRFGLWFQWRVSLQIRIAKNQNDQLKHYPKVMKNIKEHSRRLSNGKLSYE
ncbi:hypothetical protein MA16_Dca008470 [Dendrobium catenatum]|uniref:Uncharacterized protein n=1 Tax=Dendrobium catenatum TaxID=906689 RepID=A0A2I0XHL7_9ASPA|nr:hypothetical protein MA16_Dca008470 [Dendrobium catenatum]